MAHMKPSPATISRVMAVLGAIKTKKKAASSSKNLAKARAVWARAVLAKQTRAVRARAVRAKQRGLDTRSNG